MTDFISWFLQQEWPGEPPSMERGLELYFTWSSEQKTSAGKSRWVGTTLRGWYSAFKKWWLLAFNENLDRVCPIINCKLDKWEKKQPQVKKAATFSSEEIDNIMKLPNTPEFLVKKVGAGLVSYALLDDCVLAE